MTSSSPIVLGNTNDTSNFLQVAQLYNNGGDTVTSASALGGINLNSVLSSANFATPITDGGSGNGQFLINGVAINFDASTDTVSSVLQKINDSAAGVTATFDAADNKIQLTNTTTGNVGISLQDVTRQFSGRHRPLRRPLAARNQFAIQRQWWRHLDQPKQHH